MNKPAPFPAMRYADWFRRHAVTRPAVIAIATPKAKLTYAEFHRALHAAAHRLAESGIENGQTVALCVRNPALHCVLIAAINRLGARSLSLRRPASSEEAIGLPEGLALDRILLERPFAGTAPPGALDVDLEWLQAGEQPITLWQGEGLRDADAISHIFTSSGTTGTAKAIGLSTRAIEARLFKRSIGVFASQRTGRTMCLFGLRTSIGFQTVFGSFWTGGTIFAGWPESDIPALIARNAIERIEASPVQFRTILQASDPAKADLSTLRFAVVGGSATPKPLIGAIRTKLCRTLIGQYGATEIGMTSYGPLQANSDSGGVGHLVPWMNAQCVDADGNPLPPGEEGLLRFRCEEMASSYLNDAQATAECFKNGWFYPGDIGTITSERALLLSGRSTERINAGGVKVNPELIENVVMSFGFVECAAFSVPDALGVEQIWVAVVANGKIDLDGLRKTCAARLGLQAPRHFLAVDALPRNDMGKILRASLPNLAKDSDKKTRKRKAAAPKSSPLFDR